MHFNFQDNSQEDAIMSHRKWLNLSNKVGDEWAFPEENCSLNSPIPPHLFPVFTQAIKCFVFSLFNDSLFKSISHSNERINKVTGNTKTAGSLTSDACYFIRFSYLYLDLNSDVVDIFVSRIKIEITVKFYKLIICITSY